MNKDAVLRKIKALLSKTIENGVTEDEAIAAAAKAAALMDKYHIDASAAGITEDEFDRVEVLARMAWQLPAYEWIANAISAFTGCFAVKASVGVGKRYAIRFFGKQSDVDFADWLCRSLGDFILRGLESDELAMRFGRRMDAKAVNDYRRGYLLGATHRISERLRTITRDRAAAAPSGCKALIPANRALVAEQEYRSRGNMVGKASPKKRVTVSRRGLDEGHARGDAASFGRPVGGQGGVPALAK